MIEMGSLPPWLDLLLEVTQLPALSVPLIMRENKNKPTWSFEPVIEWVTVGGSITLLAVLLYALSIGPAMRSVQSTNSNKRLLLQIYQPVILLTKTPLKPYLKWYLNLWGVR